MKIINWGLSTLLSPPGDPLEGIELASDIGLDYVELILENPTISFDPAREDLEMIRDKIESCGLKARVHGYFQDLNPTSPYEEIRKVTLRQEKKSIEACEIIGGDVVTIHPGRCWNLEENEIKDNCGEWFENYLDDISSYASDKGITLGLETGSHKTDYPAPGDGLLEFVRGRKNVGITLDVGHLFILARGCTENEEELISEFIDDWGNEIVHVHIHDNNGWLDEHLSPGRGDLSFEVVMKSLVDNYDGPVILELWNPKDPAKAVSEGIEFLKEFDPKI